MTLDTAFLINACFVDKCYKYLSHLRLLALSLGQEPETTKPKLRETMYS